MPTEITAERARELAASIVAHRERVVFAGKYADEIAAALEQLASLLEKEANAMEALKACQCENCTRLMPSLAAGEKVDAARLLRSQLAASRSYISKLERDLFSALAANERQRCLELLSLVMNAGRGVGATLEHAIREGKTPDEFRSELLEGAENGE